jgi:uncharacterized protein YndB with AHSA1/START domain
MPIKKDGSGRRWVEMELVTPGTPEQVWRALATGPGNSAWFTKTTVDEHVGGQVRFDMGPNGVSVGEVTAWDPPHRFGYVERDWSEGAPPLATEITVTARSGDRCVIRMVHSLFASSDDWDDQMEGFERGWPMFFDVLRVYLAHFVGERGAGVEATSSIEGDQLSIWKRLVEGLQLTGADAGERRTIILGAERLSGVIERVRQDQQERLLMIRFDASAPAVAVIGTSAAGRRVRVSVMLYFYGEDAESRAANSLPGWQAWLSERFAGSGAGLSR